MYTFIGLRGVPPHDNARALLWQHKLHWVMIAVALFSVPAVYLEFFAESHLLKFLGWAANCFIFLAFLAEFLWMLYLSSQRTAYLLRNWLNVVIIISAAASLAGIMGDWVVLARLLRMAFVGLVFLRFMHSLHTLTPSKTPFLLMLAAITLAISGAGFYWLEPTVHSYADGLWLAFTSGATVGYGDIIPTTHASRIFAVVMVVVGYAIMSLVTASIAAFFVGEDEKLLKRDIHVEMKALREEIIQLRAELNRHRNGQSEEK